MGTVCTGFLISRLGCSHKSKPNILLICVDDLRPELGCYGKSYMKTPHLDRLASEGITFTNHYIQAPTCGPSRYCLLTGQRPQNNHQLNNNYMEKTFYLQPETEAPESFVHHFRRNGYYTVGIGKISHTPDGRIREDNKTFELPYSWDEMLCEKGIWGGGFESFFAYADGSSRAGMKHQVPPYECGNVNDEGYPDGQNAAVTVKKLRELSQRNEPFLLSVGFYKPHLPFNSPKKYWDMYKRSDIDLSPNPEAPEKTPRRFLHNSGEFFNNYRIHEDRGGAGVRISDDYACLIRHAYFAAVSYIDAQIGKVLEALRETHLDRNTIVVVWGDHGWHLGDHTIWGKHSLFERSAHSPLMIRIPGMNNGGEKSGAIVETIDLYPTLCELVGVEPPPGLTGMSLVSHLEDSHSSGKPAAFTYQRNRIAMRTDRYRLIAHKTDDRCIIALFDHQMDPNETENIAQEHPEIVNRLLPLLEGGNAGFMEPISHWGAN